MKKKGKIQLTAEILAFTMFLSAGYKSYSLVKTNKEQHMLSTSMLSSQENNSANLTEPSATENLVFSTMAMDSDLLNPEENSSKTTTPESPKIDNETLSTEESDSNTQSTAIESSTPEIEAEQETTESSTIEMEAEQETTDTLLIGHPTTVVNMRAGCGTEFKIISNLQVTDTVEKIFSYGNWDLVKHNGTVGYICSDYLAYSTDTIPSDYQYEKQSDIAITTTKDLNFRPTPSTQEKSIDTFVEGEELEVVAKLDNGWYLVKSNCQLGYVYGNYIESLTERAKNQYPDLGLTSVTPQMVIYLNNDHSLKSGMTEDSKEISQLEKYETLRVISEYDDWYFAMTNDYNFGFINKEDTTPLRNNFKIIDLSEQRLWLYRNSKLYYTTPVTTGKKNHETHICLGQVTKMSQKVYLAGADYGPVPVDFWIEYNDWQEGIHDASWRYVYGKEVDYKLYGSHGCTNTPPKIMKKVYDSTSIGDTVIVHK